jgi:hypothetical protein
VRDVRGHEARLSIVGVESIPAASLKARTVVNLS